METDSQSFLEIIKNNPEVHALLLLRSMEHAQSDADLSIILETTKNLNLPIRWNEDSRSWVSVDLIPQPL